MNDEISWMIRVTILLLNHVYTGSCPALSSTNAVIEKFDMHMQDFSKQSMGFPAYPVLWTVLPLEVKSKTCRVHQ